MRITKYLMCTYGGYLCISMKFLCLNLCQGELCTDDDTNANTDANDDDDRQFMIVQGSLVDKPNEPKTVQ